MLTPFPYCDRKSKASRQGIAVWNSMSCSLYITQCRACKTKTSCSQIFIPYAAKLLFQVPTLPLNWLYLLTPVDRLGTSKHEHRRSSLHNIDGSHSRLILSCPCFVHPVRRHCICILVTIIAVLLLRLDKAIMPWRRATIWKANVFVGVVIARYQYLALFHLTSGLHAVDHILWWKLQIGGEADLHASIVIKDVH